MSSQPTPQRLSFASAVTNSTLNSPSRTPSEAMSSPSTPLSPEARLFAPSQVATNASAFAYLIPEHQGSEDSRHAIQQEQSQWRQRDQSVKQHISSYHPRLQEICPKLTHLPYHWSSLACQLQHVACFCNETRRSIPCLRHDWRNRWAWLATGGPWRANKQEQRPRLPDILRRPLDPVVFTRWLQSLPCSCDEWEPAWEQFLQIEWEKEVVEWGSRAWNSLVIERRRLIWRWAMRYPEEDQLERHEQDDALKWLRCAHPSWFQTPTRLRMPTQFSIWMKTHYCRCADWKMEWERLFRMLEPEDVPIIPRNVTDQQLFMQERRIAEYAARERRHRNFLARQARRRRGQKVDIMPAFNNHIFDLPRQSDLLIPDDSLRWIVIRSRWIKRSPVLFRQTTWCPGKDNNGIALESYKELPGDRALASAWPTPAEYKFEGIERCSTEGGMFGRAFPLVGKRSIDGNRPVTIVNRAQRPYAPPPPENYSNLPWLRPFELDRLPTPKLDLEAELSNVAALNDSKQWPALDSALLAALDDPDLIELDDGGVADDLAYERWKGMGL